MFRLCNGTYPGSLPLVECSSPRSSRGILASIARMGSQSDLLNLLTFTLFYLYSVLDSGSKEYGDREETQLDQLIPKARKSSF